MSQNQFRPWQVLAALAQSRNTLLLRCLAVSLVVALNIHSGTALADNAPTPNLTAIQKLQTGFDALAKKDTPEKKDWKGLYEACSGLFEIREFSRVFSCVGIAEKWQGKSGGDTYITNNSGEKFYFQQFSKIMLIEAKAYLETGSYSQAIWLAKRSLAENKRIYCLQTGCQSEKTLKRSSLSGEPDFLDYGFLAEGNLLLATALPIVGKRDESVQHQIYIENLISNPNFNDKISNPSFSDKQVKANALAFKIRFYLATNRYEDAIKLEDAIRLIEKDSYGQQNLASLGRVALGVSAILSSPVNAISFIAENLTDIFSDMYTIPTKFQMAHIRFMAKRTDEAKKQLDELFNEPLIKTFGGIYWAALYDRGQIAEGEGKTDEAIRYYTSAIDEIELQRSSINSEGARIGFFGEKQNAYQSLVRLLVQTGKAEEAFLVTERSKARALVDMFANKQDFRVASADGEKLKQLLAQQQNSDNLSVFNAELPPPASAKPVASAAKPDDKTAANEAANAAATHIRNLKVEAAKDIAALPPELASLVSVTPINIGEILQNLPADETIVSYYYDKANLYAFLVDKQNVKSIKLQREGLEGEIEAFRQALQEANGKYDDKAQALHSRLIAPLITEVKTPNLVIAPHGALHYLPFAALFDGKSYLLDRYQLTFLPSASTIKFIGKTHSEDKAGNILVLGNPNLGDTRYNLPAAENEAKSIGAIFPQSMVLLGDKASKKSLNEYGAGFKYLHFAMHGKFNSDNPLGSALMLATDSVTNVNDQLTVSELYSMKLDADMVTLSACETGLGKVSNGDDVVGLVRGFLYAGANHVISTLWEIDDKATEVLMVSFYKDIKAGKSKAGSLRDSQIALRKDYPNPRFWAAFQMTGGAEDKLRVAANDEVAVNVGDVAKDGTAKKKSKVR